MLYVCVLYCSIECGRAQVELLMPNLSLWQEAREIQSSIEPYNEIFSLLEPEIKWDEMMEENLHRLFVKHTPLLSSVM